MHHKPVSSFSFQAQNSPNNKLLVVTTRDSSCGKVMFSQVSVNLFTGGRGGGGRVALVPCSFRGIGYLWFHIPFGGESTSGPMFLLEGRVPMFLLGSKVSLVPYSFWGRVPLVPCSFWRGGYPCSFRGLGYLCYQVPLVGGGGRGRVSRE